MPMDVLTLIQTVETIAVYLLVTVGLPAFVFGKKLKKHRPTEKFMLYFMIGNFYVMNLVFLLQLLHISNSVTLGLGTFVPAVFGWVRLNRVPVKRVFEDRLEDLRRLTAGSLGRRTALLRAWGACRKRLAAAGRFVGWILLRRLPDCLLTLAFLGLLCWLHGPSLLEYFGYKASDIPVHNYWINAMGQNHIFVAGVYPHGFHCVIYYLHDLFGFDTYNLLREFGFIEAVLVNLMLLLFLKLCCKSRFAAYVGAFIYAGSTYFMGHTYSRFYSALPQEFGMMFIFPAVYFGFAYFQARRQELAGEKKAAHKKGKARLRHLREGFRLFGLGGRHAKPEPQEGPPEMPPQAVEEPPKKRRRFRWRWQGSQLYLIGFAMSFSMTLAVHFYGTMIAGLFCLAMAIGYFFLFFRKKYFWNVVCTCLLSVFIAVLPMAAAFIGGTPLQGSLGWGLNVIKGSQAQAAEPEASSSPAGAQDEPGAQSGAPSGEASVETAPVPTPAPTPVPTPVPTVKDKLLGLAERVDGKLEGARQAFARSLNASVLNLTDPEHVDWIMAGFVALMALGAVLILLRQVCYGGMLLSTGIYMFFLCVMMSAKAFGLPAIMDANRGSIYFSYSLPIAVSFLIDGVLVLIFLPVKRFKWHELPMYALSLAALCLVVWNTWDVGRLRQPGGFGALEINEAIVCTENIIETERDFTWTIVSANDELRMGEDHGYHYETITFLQDMEGVEDFSQIHTRIPTPVVYIYIEKVPVNYTVRYEGSGQTVSRKGADNPLPSSAGISMYQGEKRWILMSRMYYWAKEFQRLYPNEMEVYLETEQFVCYRIEQNMYRLFDFAIDYGYNTKDYTEEEAGHDNP